MNTPVKYTLSLIVTIALTVVGANAWVWLTASNGDKLDYTKWNQLVSTVQSWIPTWAVMAFNLAGCPSGWSEYTAAAGRTVIGAGNWAGLKMRTLWETGWWEAAVSYTSTWNIDVIPGSASVDPAPLVNNYRLTGVSSTAGGPVTTTTTSTGMSYLGWLNLTTQPIGDQAWLSPSTDNMQPYVALLYCVKN